MRERERAPPSGLARDQCRQCVAAHGARSPSSGSAGARARAAPLSSVYSGSKPPPLPPARNGTVPGLDLPPNKAGRGWGVGARDDGPPPIGFGAGRVCSHVPTAPVPQVVLNNKKGSRRRKKRESCWE